MTGLVQAFFQKTYGRGGTAMKSYTFTTTLVMTTVILCAIFSSTILQADPFQTQLPKVVEFLRAHGVRSITTWDYYYHSGALDASGRKQQVQSFDHNGNLSQEIDFFVDGSVLMTQNFTYDDRHNQLSATLRGTSAQFDKDETDEYGADGRVIAAVIRSPDGRPLSRCSFEYNEIGKIGRQSCVDPEGNSTGAAISHYDSRGNLMEYIELVADGSTSKRTTHVFNSQGNATETIEYDSAGNATERTTFKYDDLDPNTLLEQTIYRPDGTVQWRKSFKYAKGLMAEELDSDAKEPQALTKYTYEFYP
jgi:hypothetical protein